MHIFKRINMNFILIPILSFSLTLLGGCKVTKYNNSDDDAIIALSNDDWGDDHNSGYDDA